MTLCWGWVAIPALHSRRACRLSIPSLLWDGQQELEAIRLKLWAMEHAEALLESPCIQRKATEEEGAEFRQLPSPGTMGRNLAPLLTLSPDGR